jgi:anti-sigma-K factor RskA
VSDHNAIRELIAPVALGAATEQETSDVERHAATCHDCRAELDLLRGAAAGLALEVPQLDPPPALKARVMDAVRAENRIQGVVAPPRRRRWALWPSLAGALAVLAAGLVVWNVSLQGNDPATRQIAFVGANDPGVSGRVVIDAKGSAVMRITGLPPLAADQSYELWTIRDGKPRSEGFAARTAQGEVVVATADLAGASALAITPERRSNTVAPSDTPIVVVPLTSTG